jgi:hypothetical protein
MKKNIKSDLKFIASIFAIISPVFLGISIGIQEQYTKPLNNHQQQQLSSAIDTICSLDKDMCEHIRKSNIKYQATYHYIPLPWVEDVTYMTGSANHADPQLFHITLGEQAFEHKNALPVLLYHELEHTRSSDVKYLEKEEKLTNAVGYCEDHNYVKQQTIELAKKLDKNGITHTPESNEKYSSIDTAAFHGNQIKDCSAL